MTGPILAIEASTSVGSAAVGDAGAIQAEVLFRAAGGASSELVPAIEEAMRLAGLTPAELAGVAVGSGPGSFTGLRIAAATAKGIVAALGAPLHAYSGLLASAVAGWGAKGVVCALFDARRNDVYAACYRFEGSADRVEVVMAPAAIAIGDLLSGFGREVPALFVGEGAVLHQSAIESATGSRVLPAHLGVPRASALVWLATHAGELGRVEDPVAWEPEYVRAAGAERIAAEGRLQDPGAA